MKNKYNDNRLAEELDWIVLTDNSHSEEGLPFGSLGTLTASYTGKDNPLFAEFAAADGSRFETKLHLKDFRVLDFQSESDLRLFAALKNASASKVS